MKSFLTSIFKIAAGMLFFFFLIFVYIVMSFATCMDQIGQDCTAQTRPNRFGGSPVEYKRCVNPTTMRTKCYEDINVVPCP